MLSIGPLRTNKKDHQTMKSPMTAKDLINHLQSIPPDTIILTFTGQFYKAIPWDYNLKPLVTISIVSQEGYYLPQELHGKQAAIII